MPWFEYLENFFKDRLLYMTGRGLMSMAFVGVALAAPGIGLMPLALAAIGLTGLLQGVLVWREQSRTEERLLEHYREEIASKLEISPAKVGVNELHKVAYGDKAEGVEANPVLRQSIEHSGEKKLLRLGSTILAALTALVAVSSFVPPEAIQSISSWVQEVSGGWLANNTTIFGAMLVSGTGMGLVNNAYDAIGESLLGLDKPTAGSQIKAINLDISRNKNVTKEQVFGVFVAADKVLADAIEEACGKSYFNLTPKVQQRALVEFGRHYPIEALTYDINHRQVKPVELAFAAVGQESGVPRKGVPQKVGEERDPVDEAVDIVKNKLVGESPAVPRQSEQNESYIAQVTRAQTQSGMSHVERELQRRSEALEQMPPLH